MGGAWKTAASRATALAGVGWGPSRIRMGERIMGVGIRAALLSVSLVCLSVAVIGISVVILVYFAV